MIDTLFRDASLGGTVGCNLNRFMIRHFPDPLTESLSFCKIMSTSEDPSISCFRMMINPVVNEMRDLGPLMESTNATGIQMSSHCSTVVQEAVSVTAGNKGKYSTQGVQVVLA